MQQYPPIHSGGSSRPELEKERSAGAEDQEGQRFVPTIGLDPDVLLGSKDVTRNIPVTPGHFIGQAALHEQQPPVVPPRQ